MYGAADACVLKYHTMKKMKQRKAVMNRWAAQTVAWTPMLLFNGDIARAKGACTQQNQTTAGGHAQRKSTSSDLNEVKDERVA